jgi:hypothetical protein
VEILFPLFAVHGCVIAPSDLLKALKNLSEELGFVDGKADFFEIPRWILRFLCIHFVINFNCIIIYLKTFYISSLL